MRQKPVLVLLTLLLLSLLPSAFALYPQREPGKIDADLEFALTRTSVESAIQVLIVSDNPFTPTQILELSSYGQVESATGHVVVLRTSMASIPELTAFKFVRSVEGPRYLSLDLDVSVREIGAPTVYERVKDATGVAVDGTGVIIGIADTGIDITHPDFRFADGSSKILYVWDQGTEGPHSNLVSYGRECTKADIDSGKCGENDSNGHGTHVAGIAASTGLATGKYAGVAPGANIIFVKIGFPTCEGSNWSASEADIINAYAYIQARARELGRPAVGSLSFGSTTGGGHDGTSAFERALDDIIQGGLPIVTSAGNSQSDESHVRGTISQGNKVTVVWEGVSTFAPIEGFYTEVWYDTQDLLDISVTTPSGETIQGSTGQGGASTQSGRVYVFDDETSKGRGWTIFVEPTGTDGLPASGWSFTITGTTVRSTGRWDGWVDINSCDPTVHFVSGSGYAIDRSGTVGIPGTANEIIAVGSYVTRNSWPVKSGQQISRPGAPIGALSVFSSLGPSRDGRTKPEIAAPGEYILSAKSLLPDATLPTSLGELGPDDYHIPLRGTSMAAPHAAGVVALMLQRNPSFSPRQVLEALRSGARQDAATARIDPATGDNGWGWGKIDARTVAGMFRVTIVASELPSGLQTPVRIDGTNVATLSGTQSTSYWFLQGETHSIAIDEFVLSREPGLRYRATTYTISAARTVFLYADYIRQFLLTVNGPDATGGGWYDEDTVAQFSAAQGDVGILGILGGRSDQVWYDEKNQTLNQTSILMDSPHTVTAVYVEDLSLTYVSLAAIIVMAIATVGLILFQRRKRRTTM